MVTFLRTMGGFDVMVGGKLFGRLQKSHGFFTDATVVRDFVEVSPDDLIAIALKAQEVKADDMNVPVCGTCRGVSCSALQRLNEVTHVIEYSPNCPKPFLLRLVGRDVSIIDKKYYDKTKDILGFGTSLAEAAHNAFTEKGNSVVRAS